MSLFKFQVTLPMKTGINEDAVVNSWYAFGAGAITTWSDSFVLDLQNFYNTCSLFLSSLIDDTKVLIKVYDMVQPEPRPPVVVETIPITSPGATVPLPPELCIVFSYHGAYVAGIPPARRRGRVFVGPLSTNALSNARVPTSAINALQSAGTAMLNTSAAAAEYDWVQVSHTSIPFQSTNVIGGWIDDAHDIQRRRGLSPTIRTTFGAPPQPMSLAQQAAQQPPE